MGLALGRPTYFKPVNAAVVRSAYAASCCCQTLARSARPQRKPGSRVAQRTHELEQALEVVRQSQEQLARSEALVTLSTLIASVSHEMGTPLGNAGMLASTLWDQTQEFQRAAVGRLDPLRPGPIPDAYGRRHPVVAQQPGACRGTAGDFPRSQPTRPVSSAGNFGLG